MWANYSGCTPKMSKLQGWEFAHWFSEGITRFLRKTDQISNFLKKTSNLLIFGEWPERFAYGCSFLVKDVSELLMVAHFWWATWAACSHCSFLVRALSDSLTSLIKQRNEKIALFLNKKNKKYYFSQFFFMWIAHLSRAIWANRSFDMNDMSNLLTVAHLS